MNIGKTYRHKYLTNIYCKVIDSTAKGVKVLEYIPTGNAKQRKGATKYYYKTDFPMWEEANN